MSAGLSLGFLLLSFLAGRRTLKTGKDFLLQVGVTGLNYREERIPTAYGGFLASLLLFLSVIALGLAQWIPLFSYSLFAAVLLASITVSFLGWLDDTLGNHRDKGFSGHFRTWIKEGRLTTGLLKAAGGGAVAAISATVTSGGSGKVWLLHTLLIGLMTNWLNLLDLRPGRALKFYLVVGSLLFLVSLGRGELFLFIPLLGLGAAILKGDLSSQLMLGDSGSNLLGVQLGMWLALVSPTWLVMVWIAFLAVGHWVGETISLTRLIDGNRFLSYLDRLGRE